MCIMLQIGFLIVAVLFLLKAVMRTIRRKIRLAKEYKQRQQIGKRGEEDTVRQLERCRFEELSFGQCFLLGTRRSHGHECLMAMRR